MGSCSTQQKKEILARMSAFSYCGFSVKVTGNICYYYQSFVGRDFKAWLQMAVFIIAPYLSAQGKKCWLLLSKVNWQTQDCAQKIKFIVFVCVRVCLK